MKKYYISFLLALLIITSFSFGVLIQTASAVTAAVTPSMTVSQFIEMLITIGAVAPDKVVAARAVATQLGTVTTISTTGSIATNPAPYFQVLSPNGAESWDIDLDLPYTIKWGSSSNIPVNIAFVPAKGASCNITSAPITSRNGENTFNVLLKTAKCYNSKTGTSTALVGGSYKAQVSAIVGTSTIKDESNAVFKINPKLIPSIKVTYPNGGESLVKNKDYVVKYTLANTTTTGSINFSLINGSGDVVYSTSKPAIAAKTITVKFPSSLSPDAYKVKLKTSTTGHDAQDIEDVSDNFFWVSTSL